MVDNLEVEDRNEEALIEEHGYDVEKVFKPKDELGENFCQLLHSTHTEDGREKN